MLLKSLAFAATATAFVIVPEITAADEGVFRALPIHDEAYPMPASAVSQTLSIPCPQCKGQSSQLRLGFAVEDGWKLLLNDFELYPNADPWSGDLLAGVIKGNGEEEQQRLGYSLAIEPVAMDTEQHMQLINIELRVVEVGGRFVRGIPAVKVQLIKASTHDIAIGNVDIMDPTHMQCSSAWCRAKNLITEGLNSLRKFKGCAGRWRKGGPSSNASQGQDGQDDAAGSVVDGKLGKATFGRHGHHFHHNWRQLLRNIASHIFLPALMGLAAGVSVAAFAMILCSVIIRLTSFARNRCARKQQQKVSDAEKDGLLEEGGEEPPPQYKDDESQD